MGDSSFLPRSPWGRLLLRLKQSLTVFPPRTETNESRELSLGAKGQQLLSLPLASLPQQEVPESPVKTKGPTLWPWEVLGWPGCGFVPGWSKWFCVRWEAMSPLKTLLRCKTPRKQTWVSGSKLFGDTVFPGTPTQPIPVGKDSWRSCFLGTRHTRLLYLFLHWGPWQSRSVCQ